MYLRFGDSRIDGGTSEHYAWSTKDGWQVSWLPDRYFDQNGAITAMMIAEAYSESPPPSSPVWIHVKAWKDEIGLTDMDRPA
ncbi:hypothetical protein DMH04_30260 [Kibdelosporangium aridum]|uniref:Uncharacterized protein n=1 Tax=Kibdelosporangium aridum TaxID=2030 RepID=A0A428Z389_KIBAR|nr:hypothetical protein DMH04_30260 [Kibdelosporangium aridum]